MLDFARSLPDIRAMIAEHMGRRGLQREKVIATVVHLLETTLIRVGNDDYAKQNKDARAARQGRGGGVTLPFQGQKRQDLADQDL